MQTAPDHPAGERHTVLIALEWNPNTGQLSLNAKDANPAEILGVLQMAMLEAYAATKTPAPVPSILPVHGPMRPHLKG